MRKFIPLIAALALLGGCTRLMSAPPPAPGTAPALADSAWRFTAIDGAPPSGEATLTFQPDRLIANAGCNRMGATWRFDAGKLVTGPLMATRMFCEGKMDQERQVSELLGAAPEVMVHGDRLTLKGSTHSAELTRTK